MSGVFVSYSHRQGEWVWDRLVPCLRAGGARVLVDRDRFEAGKGVLGQMDALQDSAHRQLLVLSPDYLSSDYCTHEMQRAIATDPDFRQGRVLPVLLESCDLPDAIRRPNPLYADLRDPADGEAWSLLLRQCGADLGTSAADWLAARDRLRRYLSRRESINLVADPGVAWRPLLEEVEQALSPLVGLDLERGAAASRRGFLTRILRELGHGIDLPAPPEDLVRFDELMDGLPRFTLVLRHFDLVDRRRDSYGVDFFAMLHNLVMDRRRLVLLIHSRAPFGSLVPQEHPLSGIHIKTVVLRGRP